MRISDWSSDVCSSDLRGIDLIEADGLLAACRGDVARHRREIADLRRHVIERVAEAADRPAPSRTWLCEVSISVRMSLAALAERWASARTSRATTAKP